MLRQGNCSSWIPIAQPHAKNLPAPTPNVWPNWTAHFGAPAWTRCVSTPPRLLRKLCSIFLKLGGGEGGGEHPNSNIQIPENFQDPTSKAGASWQYHRD